MTCWSLRPGAAGALDIRPEMCEAIRRLYTSPAEAAARKAAAREAATGRHTTAATFVDAILNDRAGADRALVDHATGGGCKALCGGSLDRTCLGAAELAARKHRRDLVKGFYLVCRDLHSPERALTFRNTHFKRFSALGLFSFLQRKVGIQQKFLCNCSQIADKRSACATLLSGVAEGPIRRQKMAGIRGQPACFRREGPLVAIAGHQPAIHHLGDGADARLRHFRTVVGRIEQRRARAHPLASPRRRAQSAKSRCPTEGRPTRETQPPVLDLLRLSPMV